VIQTDALLLRATKTGESSLILHLFTETHGKVAAIAFSGRRSGKRFSALEPLHTLRVELADDGSELAQLKSAAIARPRTGYMSSLPRMEAACRGLTLLRDAVPDRNPEPALWASALAFLDAAERCAEEEALSEAAAFGVKLVVSLGWAVPPSVRPGVDPARALRAIEAAVKASVS
jgi:DNA repair protein RecO (recombination protein O)